MLTKFTYTSKIHLNQSINYLLIQEKKLGLNTKKNPKIFIDYSQTIDDVYRLYIIYKIIIQQRKQNCLLSLMT